MNDFLPDAVRWYEGMRLAPQHLQQQAARGDALAPLLLRSVLPMHWGLLDLDLRQDGATVTVTQVAAIMPDGLPVSSRPDDVLRIDLDQAAADADGVWRLALAVPPPTDGEQAGPQRFRATGSARLADQNPGGGAMTVSLLRPNLQLVCGHAHGYATDALLPLAHFQSSGGAPRATSYIAPWLHVGPALPLHLRIKALCRNLRSNYHSLTHENGADAARRQAVLPALASRLLELEVVHDDGQAHPHRLFLLLAGLLGVLASGVPALALPALPRFDYRDLAPAMESVLAQIEQARARLAPDFHWAPFTPRRPHDYEIDLGAVAAAAPCVIALHKPVRASDADMQRWLREALVCSAGREGDLQRRRSRGVGKTALGAEQAQRIGGDSARALFQLDTSGDAAEYFDAAAPLRILGPGGSSDNYIEPMAIDLLLRRDAPPGGDA